MCVTRELKSPQSFPILIFCTRSPVPTSRRVTRIYVAVRCFGFPPFSLCANAPTLTNHEYVHRIAVLLLLLDLHGHCEF